MKRSALRRVTPLRRKHAKPRRRRTRCTVLRCKDYPYREGDFDGKCRSHVIEVIDAAVRQIRRDQAMSACQDDRPHEHRGRVQWCHGIRRGLLLVRWWVPPDRIPNTFMMCEGAHAYYTNRPEAWNVTLRRWLGDDGFWTVHQTAMSDGNVDAEIERCWRAYVRPDVSIDA